ncbi:MAG: hypothetical protein LAP85_08095 [Acidobacteriia bacterium]|nr:hypothetical protein [Terriglobia bacterium]
MKARHSHLLQSLVFMAACLTLAGVLLGQGRGGGAFQGPPPNVSTDPLLRGFNFRSIGPATMMGRVDDIEGAEKDPMIMYVGFATGGLWKSTDGGIHWRSLFNEMPNESIGDIAIAASDPNVVYVGMGEANNRQSSSIGDGVWGTRDGGQTWQHLGLEDTQSIGRVAVDPTNPDIVFVAALGHLFGPNEERGLYKSVDGGKTWKKAKYIDADTGFTDLAIDPSNPKTIYAASYQRRRTWWGFNGGGPGSGLWKSTDGGDTWTKITGNGWPAPKDGIIGRIAIAICKAKPNVVYAQVQAGASGGTGAGTAADGGPSRGGGGGGGGGRGSSNAPPDPNGNGVFRSDDGGKTWTIMSNQNQRPMYFSQIRVDPVNDQKVFVGGNPGQISLDGGKTWQRLVGSHADYHAIWINPKDPRIVATGHDGGLDISNDGGLTGDYHNDVAVGQFYQVSTDMRRPYYVCGGLQDNNAWCGPSALRSNTGPVNSDWYTVAGGDGFYTRQDPTDWAIVYAESQNGNMSRHDLRQGTQKSIRPNVGGGRGGGAAATETETPTVPQGGGGRGGGVGNIINPPANPDAFRFYWNAPFEISPHNPAVIYMAAQYFFKSTNRGDTWWMNPKDLTKNFDRFSTPIMGVAGNAPMAEKHDGNSSNSLVTQIRESPSKPGVIWIGTDDGMLQISTDGGVNFADVYNNIRGVPKGYVQISRIEPSHFDPGTAYVALDNHRNDDWKPYLFKTADYGKTWTNVTANLPAKGNVNALREDYDNPNLLFVGTEFGLFVSVDGGRDWKKFMSGMPNVRVDDILIHPRDRDLIIGTHGRSIWIADDITPLEQLAQTSNSSLVLFDPRPAIQWKTDPQAQRHPTNRDFSGQNPPRGTALSFWAKADLGDAKIEILQGGQVIRTIDTTVRAGMNRTQWDMFPDTPAGDAGGRGRGGAQAAPVAGGAAGAAGQAQVAAGAAAVAGAGRGGRGGGGRGGGGGASPVQPGAYMVRLIVGGQTLTTSVVVLEDIWMGKN